MEYLRRYGMASAKPVSNHLAPPEMKEYVRFKIYLPAIRLWNLVVDKYYGINTEVIIELPSLGLEETIGNRQESTPTHHLRKILSFLSINSEDVFIDVETVICCYEFRVEGGSLLLEPSTENSIYGPDLFISGNASLIFSGKNKFTSSNGVDTRMEGINDGYLEIKNNGKKPL